MEKKKTTQGEFIKQLRDVRGYRHSQAKEGFGWKADVASPSRDKSAPRTNFDDKGLEPPVTDKLPKTLSGGYDIAEIRQDLTQQLKSQRKK